MRPAIVAASTRAHSAYISDFPTAATVKHPKCVTMPHLGASTAEAEDNCAIMVADQVRDFLEHGHVRNAVNFPTGGAAPTAHRWCAGAWRPPAAATITSCVRRGRRHRRWPRPAPLEAT